MPEHEEVVSGGRPVPHVVEAVQSAPWAITHEGLAIILAVALRENVVTLEALEAYRAKRVQNAESLSIRDGVGVITIAGPLFKYADFFTSLSAATTYEGVRQDLALAVDNPAVRAILLNVDSPGGQVNGCSELAAAIRAASAAKPVWAYVGGQGASAAYWVASAAKRIIIGDTAIVGSIGVRMGIRDTSERDAKSGVKMVEFVSSQSPNKAIDHNLPEGQKKIQKTVDDLAAVFIGAVAGHRGVSPADVVEKFGAGGVKIGAEAVAAGMADELGSFEGALKALASASVSPSFGKGLRAMADNTHTAEDLSKAVAEGQKGARERIRSILTSEEAKGRTGLAEHLAYDTEMSVEAARTMLGKAAKDTPSPSDASGGARAEGRARDAAGGLAHADRTSAELDDKRTETKAETKTIDAAQIYGKLNRGDLNAKR